MGKSAISPKRSEDYANWYLEVIKAAELADHAPVRGCMMIKPWGYAIWERMVRVLDDRFKELGNHNIYLPLFIPLSYFQKEADQVAGFAKECAVVTHHRLKDGENGLEPDGKLEEPLVVRPTSEPLFGNYFAKSIQSHRDLPVRVNQWANVVRWEMRTRLFLRTSEFLWQEGHTAHATSQEAIEEAKNMQGVYQWFSQDVLSIPVLCGEKTENERFGGADITYTIEAMMQDGKALQSATSHYLGQNFSKAFEVSYQTESNEMNHVYTTSWGSTTRFIGALIMTHADDDGLRLPPKIAPYQIVVLPIIHNEEDKELIMNTVRQVQSSLAGMRFDDEKIRVHVDDRDMRGGDKAWSWFKKGVPLRIEIGKREAQSAQISVVKRTGSYRDRVAMGLDDLSEIPVMLDGIQSDLFHSAKTHLDENTTELQTREEVEQYFKDETSKRGFVIAPFRAPKELESEWCKGLGISTRCILPGEANKPCILTGQMAPLVVFARAY